MNQPVNIPLDVWCCLPVEIQREIIQAGTVPSRTFRDKENEFARDVRTVRSVRSVRSQRETHSITKWFNKESLIAKSCKQESLMTASHLKDDALNIDCQSANSTRAMRCSGFQRQARIFPLITELTNEVKCFVDTDFTASAESIDGRKLPSTTSPYNINGVPSNEPVKCSCGLNARLRQVYKNGPNQGRYFLSCFTRQCSYFSWADDCPHDAASVKMVWRRFEKKDGWKLVGKGGFSPHHILQGGVGDCWFLSALAVLAERISLLEQVVVDRELSDDGKVNFRLFLDGDWQDVFVDTFLPCRAVKKPGRAESKKTATAVDKITADNHAVTQTQDIDRDLTLAYSRASQRQLWVPLLEKAYAKAHGSYRAVSGGHIHEALLDLTGCPCEVIDFTDQHFDSEHTWIRLVSFHQSGFPMGCATAVSGEGIVGNHAYSILNVRELENVTLGEQTVLDHYFTQFGEAEENLSAKQMQGEKMMKYEGSVRDSEEDELAGDSFLLFEDDEVNAPHLFAATDSRPSDLDGRQNRRKKARVMSNKVSELLTDEGNLRVLQIRNPWGKKEWQGQFGSDSEVWTNKLANLLGKGSKNDGTFWITYHDFLRRYTSVDVCKTHSSDWQGISYPIWTQPGGQIECQSYLIMTVLEPTWMYLTVIQPTKRGRNATARDRSYWYSALSLIVCPLQDTSQISETTEKKEDILLLGDPIAACFCGAIRDTPPLELHLPPGSYAIIAVDIPDRCPVLPVVHPTFHPPESRHAETTKSIVSIERGGHSYTESAGMRCQSMKGQQVRRFVVRVFSANPTVVETMTEEVSKRSVRGHVSNHNGNNASEEAKKKQLTKPYPQDLLKTLRSADGSATTVVLVPVTAVSMTSSSDVIPLLEAEVPLPSLTIRAFLKALTARPTLLTDRLGLHREVITSVRCNDLLSISGTCDHHYHHHRQREQSVTQPPPVPVLPVENGLIPSGRRPYCDISPMSIQGEQVDLSSHVDVDDNDHIGCKASPVFNGALNPIDLTESSDDESPSTNSPKFVQSHPEGSITIEALTGNEIIFVCATSTIPTAACCRLTLLCCNCKPISPFLSSTSSSGDKQSMGSIAIEATTAKRVVVSSDVPNRPKHSEYSLVFMMPARTTRLIAVLKPVSLYHEIDSQFLSRAISHIIGQNGCHIAVRELTGSIHTDICATTSISGNLLDSEEIEAESTKLLLDCVDLRYFSPTSIDI